MYPTVDTYPDVYLDRLYIHMIYKHIYMCVCVYKMHTHTIIFHAY